VDVDEFIAVKSHRAKGKRISNYDIDTLRFIEPEYVEEEQEDMAADEAFDGEDMVDIGDIVGDDIKADPDVDYSQREEFDDAGFSASQLDLFS
jgi:topoisomerase-4 subunit A